MSEKKLRTIRCTDEKFEAIKVLLEIKKDGRAPFDFDRDVWPIYLEARAKAPISWLTAIRVGDFYELFHDEAGFVARLCEITLTGREVGGRSIPMCGLPFHSVERYLAKAIDAGYRIALVDGVS